MEISYGTKNTEEELFGISCAIIEPKDKLRFKIIIEGNIVLLLEIVHCACD